MQPVKRVYLDAVHPDLPVQVRACGSTGPPYQTDHLTGLHQIADIHKDL
jgi:hypothetical protein